MATELLEPFLWGQGGQRRTPEQIARDREVAQALLGIDTSPVAHPLQGAARVAQAAAGAFRNFRADQAEKANNAYWGDKTSGWLSSMGTTMSGGFPAAPGAPASATPVAAAPATTADALAPNSIYSGFMDTVKGGGIDNPYALAAIAATGRGESGFSEGNAFRTWNDPSQSGDPGTAGGIMSWRGPRLKAMQDFVAAKGGDPNRPAPELQAQFFLQEDPQLVEALRGAKSADEAMQLMNNAWRFAGYDQPGNTEVNRRLSYANSYLPSFQQSPAATASGQVATGGAPAGGILSYANENAIRSMPVNEGLAGNIQRAVAEVYGPGYTAQVYSGGQPGKGSGGKRTGSIRHDHGRAADVYIIGPDGKRVTGDRLAPLGQYWRANKFGGVGMEMRGGGIHLDDWTTPPPGGGMSWNYADQGGSYTPAMAAAIEQGSRGVMPMLYAPQGGGGRPAVDAVNALATGQLPGPADTGVLPFAGPIPTPRDFGTAGVPYDPNAGRNALPAAVAADAGVPYKPAPTPLTGGPLLAPGQGDPANVDPMATGASGMPTIAPNLLRPSPMAQPQVLQSPQMDPVRQAILASPAAPTAAAAPSQEQVRQALTALPVNDAVPMAGGPNALPQAAPLNPELMQALSDPTAPAGARSVAQILLQEQMQQQASIRKQQQDMLARQQELQRRRQAAQATGIDPQYASDDDLWKGATGAHFRDPQRFTVDGSLLDQNGNVIYQAPQRPTGEMQNLEFRARQAGLQPGTPEYQRFMATGGNVPQPEYGFMQLPDGTVVRTNKQTGEAGAAFQGQPASRPMTPQERANWGIPATDTRPFMMTPEGAKVIGGNNGVTVNLGGEPDGDAELRKKLSGKEGESWAAYKDAGTVSAGTVQDMEMLDQLLSVAPQGPIEGRLAQFFPGISSSGAAAESIVKRVAPTLRAPGSGATSDIEYDGMLRSLPGLQNNPEANRAISAMMKAKARLNVARSDIITQYQNEEITAKDARRELSKLNSASILTPEIEATFDRLGIDVRKPADEGGTPLPGDVVDGYRFKGGDPRDQSNWEQAN